MRENFGPRALANGEYLWPGTERIMGWDMKGDGFGVVLSPELPNLIRTRFGEALQNFLAPQGLGMDDFDGFLFHPGGRKGAGDGRQRARPHRPRPPPFLESAPRFRQHVVGDRAVRAGRAIRSGARGRHLLAAFGPGFSAYFMVLEL